MSQVLVGVFDSFEQAEHAIVRLTQAGTPRSDMEIHANGQTEDALAVDSPVEQQPAVTTEESSSKIGRFFSNLFGHDEPPAEVGHYQEAVRRGGAVLTVTVVDETQ